MDGTDLDSKADDRSNPTTCLKANRSLASSTRKGPKEVEVSKGRIAQGAILERKQGCQDHLV